MSYSNDWTVTNNPADHSKFKNIPASVRKIRTDVEERLAAMLYGFTSGETDTGAKYLQFKNQAGNPGTPSAGFVRLFCKAVQATIMRLFIIDQNALVVEVSTESQSADIASAGTCDLSTATGRFVKITGTTTITSFGTSPAGTVRKLRFAGALTLTHNATSLILPGAANITTAADDRAEMISLGSGNWFCQNYTRANGSAIVGGAFPVGAVFLSVVSTNPNTLLGYGTWSQIAGGRVLVGQTGSDADFDTAEETGGSKTNPEITVPASAMLATEGTTNPNASSVNHTHTVSAGAFSIMNPYFVVYIWKRTA